MLTNKYISKKTWVVFAENKHHIRWLGMTTFEGAVREDFSEEVTFKMRSAREAGIKQRACPHFRPCPRRSKEQ